MSLTFFPVHHKRSRQPVNPMESLTRASQANAVKDVCATTGFLFSAPSFLSGMATVVDLGAALHQYNVSDTPEEADARALRSDWISVHQDLLDAMSEVITRTQHLIDVLETDKVDVVEPIHQPEPKTQTEPEQLQLIR